jgi:hypothetical protein
MILEAPTDHGRTNFSNEVIACTNDVALQDLAKLCINHFLRCCERPMTKCNPSQLILTKPIVRSVKGRTPAASYHPSTQSFDDEQETLKYLLEEAPQNHQTAKKKVSLSRLVV